MLVMQNLFFDSKTLWKYLHNDIPRSISNYHSGINVCNRLLRKICNRRIILGTLNRHKRYLRTKDKIISNCRRSLIHLSTIKNNLIPNLNGGIILFLQLLKVGGANSISTIAITTTILLLLLPLLLLLLLLLLPLRLLLSLLLLQLLL